MIRRAAQLLALTALLSAASARANDELPSTGEDWQPLAERLVADNRARVDAGADPLTAPMTVCSGTACIGPSEVRLDEREAALIRAAFDPGAENAVQERAMVARAIARYETFVGARNGTWRDHARNLHEEGEEGQMDCISESVNTRTYLDRLDRAGLLPRHRVGGFVMRYLIVLQHVAVEMIEEESGDSWVVDSWASENGEEPVIAPYGSWRMELLV